MSYFVANMWEYYLVKGKLELWDEFERCGEYMLHYKMETKYG